ncbi:unnamed protein product [Parascedosporium putredinis]|uniref:Uncharacterized protein n=1 Tax=Parascedosporium putredinis TaxID=1442378 RepID=A0A9P1H468_9PEZI|nr:unnamed protein product [Parascedosporium putredinis]CAI7995413.1 unnamed protein product [Parascedosporium putredinis]
MYSFLAYHYACWSYGILPGMPPRASPSAGARYILGACSSLRFGEMDCVFEWLDSLMRRRLGAWLDVYKKERGLPEDSGLTKVSSISTESQRGSPLICFPGGRDGYDVPRATGSIADPVPGMFSQRF